MSLGKQGPDWLYLSIHGQIAAGAMERNQDGDVQIQDECSFGEIGERYSAAVGVCIRSPQPIVLGLADPERRGATMTDIRPSASREKIADFCRRSHIRRLALFGSILRADFGPESDVDVLVEFQPGHVPGFFGLFNMEEELSVLFGGRRVDLRTEKDLSRYFRDEVLARAEEQYAEE